MASAIGRGAAGSTRDASPPTATSSTGALLNAGDADTTLEATNDVELKGLGNAMESAPLFELAKSSEDEALGCISSTCAFGE